MSKVEYTYLQLYRLQITRLGPTLLTLIFKHIYIYQILGRATYTLTYKLVILFYFYFIYFSFYFFFF